VRRADNHPQGRGFGHGYSAPAASRSRAGVARGKPR
jgi:hypothetical protein